jgi:NACalpha-BTF3-like transcription factor
MNAQSLAQAQALGGAGAGGMQTLEKSGVAGGADDDDDIPELEEAADEGPVDETGVDPKDIDLVMQQVGCSRAKAVKVLKDSGGDLINASAWRKFYIEEHVLIAALQSWPPASDHCVIHFLPHRIAACLYCCTPISPKMCACDTFALDISPRDRL